MEATLDGRQLNPGRNSLPFLYRGCINRSPILAGPVLRTRYGPASTQWRRRVSPTASTHRVLS
jgi:hypothetical protein